MLRYVPKRLTGNPTAQSSKDPYFQSYQTMESKNMDWCSLHMLECHTGFCFEAETIRLKYLHHFKDCLNIHQLNITNNILFHQTSTKKSKMTRSKRFLNAPIKSLHLSQTNLSFLPKLCLSLAFFIDPTIGWRNVSSKSWNFAVRNLAPFRIDNQRFAFGWDGEVLCRRSITATYLYIYIYTCNT